MTDQSRMAGVVLAAGASSRFGSEMPKQLAHWRGETLVHRAVRAACARLDPVLLVVGHRDEQVRAAVADLVAAHGVRVVPNPSWRSGQSSSVRAAVAALDPFGRPLDGSPRVEAAAFLPCDQPGIDEAVLDTLRLAWRHRDGEVRALVPVYGTADGARRPAAPVVFASTLFPTLRTLTGDEGGRQILASLGDAVRRVDMPESARADDIDTREDLDRLQATEDSS